MKAKEEQGVLKKALADDMLSDEELCEAVGGVSAVEILDTALQYAVAQEAALHATKPQLDYTYSHLTASSENVQSPDSTHSKADMSKKLPAFSKNDILNQAQSSMMAQANTLSNGVSNLLQ